MPRAIQRLALPIRVMPLAIATGFQPCMVLVELGLLDMCGCEVARILRESAESHDLRLIALTSSREHAGRERAGVGGVRTRESASRQ